MKLLAGAVAALLAGWWAFAWWSQRWAERQMQAGLVVTADSADTIDWRAVPG